MLTIEQLIKIIIGILVVVAVVLGIYLFFKNDVIDFFTNINQTEPAKILTFLIN